MSSKQKGFGVIETLLILIALGLIVFAGWYVYQTQQSVDPSSSETTSQEAQSEEVPEVNESGDLEEAQDFVESKDVDNELDSNEIDSSLNQ